MSVELVEQFEQNLDPHLHFSLVEFLESRAKSKILVQTPAANTAAAPQQQSTPPQNLPALNAQLKTLTAAKLAVLQKTDMVDLMPDAGGAANTQGSKKKQALIAKYQALKEQVKIIFPVFFPSAAQSPPASPSSESTDEPVLKFVLPTQNFMNALPEAEVKELQNLGASKTDKLLDALFSLGQAAYQSGSYVQAFHFLNGYHVLTGGASGHSPGERSTIDGSEYAAISSILPYARPDNRKQMSLMWGMLAASIMAGDWQRAIVQIRHIRDEVDPRTDYSPQKDPSYYVAPSGGAAGAYVDETGTAGSSNTISSILWLLHWSLFAFFKCPNHQSSTTELLEQVFEKDRYALLNAVEGCAPHLIRYLIAACLLNWKHYKQMLWAAQLVSRLSTSRVYADEFTAFIEALRIKNDFHLCIKTLNVMKQAIGEDYFLRNLQHELVDNAQKLIFEDYIRTHSSVPIAFFAQYLEVPADKAEVWLAKLVRDQRNAKIDSVQQCIRVSPVVPTVHQRVLDKLRSVDRPMLNN